MDAITILGLAAAALTTVSLFPQLIRVVKTKSTKDISTSMFTFFCIGVFLWFVYGLLTSHVPIILANFFACIQAVVILAYKIKYK
jgi:MtN3 and saliva related transmembrane protein